MQSLKEKILEGFYTNTGADSFIKWINEVFKTTNAKHCTRIYITSKGTADIDQYMTEFKVTKADNISLLFSNKDLHTPYKKQSITINISEIPELLNIKPNDVSIFCTKNDDKNENIKFLFGQYINMRGGGDNNTYINNVLLTINKKTGAIIDKEVIPKFLINVLPF